MSRHLALTLMKRSKTAALIRKKYSWPSRQTQAGTHSSDSDSSDDDSCFTRKRLIAPNGSPSVARKNKYSKSSLIDSSSPYSSSSNSDTDSYEDSEDSLVEASSTPEWPCNTSKEECVHRDNVLKNYIKGHTWYTSQEFHLLRTMIMKPEDVPGWNKYYKKYPLVYDWEWESHGSGKGDLLCTDGENRFLVVELKSLINSGTGSGKTQRTGRKSKKRVGENQANKFAEAWHDGNPQVRKTTGIFVTNEETQLITELPVTKKGKTYYA